MVVDLFLPCFVGYIVYNALWTYLTMFRWRVNIKGAFFYPHTQRVNFTLCFFYADCLHSIKIHVPLQPAKEEAVVH